MERFYVYVFLDSTKPGEWIYEDFKFDFEPFYIGKGTADRMITSKYDKKTFKSNKIKSIEEKGAKIISKKIFENLSLEESITLEIELIKKIGRRDLNLGPLTNLTDGGDGRLNGKNSQESVEKARIKLIKIAKERKDKGKDKHTQETIERLRQLNLGENNPMFGKTHTDKVKEEQSLRVSGSNHPMFGKKHDEETIKLIKESRNAAVDQEKVTEESRLRNSKAILQYSLDGKFIKEFESIKVAANETGLSESLIGKTCRGVVKNPRKFIFKFKDEGAKVFSNSYQIKEGDVVDGYKLIKRNKMSVTCEDLSGELVNLRKREYPIFWEKKSL
jgi:group I intron endonuclease